MIIDDIIVGGDSMKSKKVKKILLIALTCVAISASVSAEAAMKSQITIESKNKYEQLKISESRVYGNTQLEIIRR